MLSVLQDSLKVRVWPILPAHRKQRRAFHLHRTDDVWSAAVVLYHVFGDVRCDFFLINSLSSLVTFGSSSHTTGGRSCILGVWRSFVSVGFSSLTGYCYEAKRVWALRSWGHWTVSPVTRIARGTTSNRPVGAFCSIRRGVRVRFISVCTGSGSLCRLSVVRPIRGVVSTLDLSNRSGLTVIVCPGGFYLSPDRWTLWKSSFWFIYRIYKEEKVFIKGTSVSFLPRSALVKVSFSKDGVRVDIRVSNIVWSVFSFRFLVQRGEKWK